MSGSGYRYWAFISYSHQDRTWGDWLHRALETYRVPRALVGREGRDGSIPRRIAPVFRDREELPTSADLGRVIEEALESSRYLVVVCSPRSAHSRWVNEEVLKFKRMGRSDRILCLIVDGEPNASDKPDLGAEECFPEATRYVIDAAGELTDERTEALAADVRPGADGRQDAKLKLISGLLGVGFDELKRRELQRRQRRLLAVTGVSVVVMALMAVLAFWALLAEREADRHRVAAEQQRQEAEGQRLEAERRLAQVNRNEGLRLMESGDVGAALVRLVEALAIESDAAQRRVDRVRINWLLRHAPIPRVLWPGSTSPGEQPNASISGDGRWLALSRGSTPVRVMDLRTGEVKVTVEAGEVKSLTLSRDGGRLLTLSVANELRLWDARAGEPLGPAIKPPTYVARLALSPDGGRIVASLSTAARVWDGATGEPVTPWLQHAGPVMPVAFSPDGSRVLSGGWSKQARQWDARTGESIGEPMPHGAVLQDVGYSPDGEQVITVGMDFRVRSFDAETGRPLSEAMPFTRMPTVLPFKSLVSGQGPARTPLPQADRLVAQLYTRSGRVKVDERSERVVSVRDVVSNRPLTPPLHHQDPVYRATLSEDGRWLMTYTTSGAIRVWEVIDGEEPLALTQPEAIAGVAVSPDGRRLATRAGATVRLWDLDTGEVVRSLTLEGPSVFGLAFDPSGETLIFTQGKAAHRWRASDGASLDEAVSVPGQAVAFGSGGRRVVFLGAGMGVYDVNTFEPIGKRVEGTDRGWVKDVVFLPGESGEAVAIEVGQPIRAIDLSSGVWQDHPLSAVDEPQRMSASPDGRLTLVRHMKHYFRVYDTVTGEAVSSEIRPLLPGLVGGVFSPDGSRLLIGGGNAVRVWSVSGEPLTPPMRHEAKLASVAFSVDGELIVTGDEDGVLRVWDARTGQAVTTRRRVSGATSFVAITPGRRVVARGQSDNGVVKVWKLGSTSASVAELRRAAQAVAGRRIDSVQSLSPIPATELVEELRWLRDVWGRLVRD